MSMNIYRAPGSVANATSRHQYFHPVSGLLCCLPSNSRPANRASVVKVPCSASNRSIKGVNATMFSRVWKNPIWMKGNVFNRYTRDRSNQQSPSSSSCSGGCLFILDRSPISFGISEPHCITFHTVCNSTSQNTKIITIHARVKSGRRRI